MNTAWNELQFSKQNTYQKSIEGYPNQQNYTSLIMYEHWDVCEKEYDRVVVYAIIIPINDQEYCMRSTWTLVFRTMIVLTQYEVKEVVNNQDVN